MLLPVMGASAPAPSSVTLLQRQALGPFDVSTLAATDSHALGDWLSANGYNLSPEVVSALAPYIAQEWEFIAVRLSPGAGADQLTGALDPLWITFDYDQIVYPMRPSALARQKLSVFMYILADHRVQKPMTYGTSTVQYADWVNPAALAKDSPLLSFIPKRLFLTKIVDEIYQPADIQNDFVFGYAARDEIYIPVRYHYINEFAGIPICILVPCSLLLFLLGAVLVIRSRIRKNSNAHTLSGIRGANP
jgi:hypothetical protein